MTSLSKESEDIFIRERVVRLATHSQDGTIHVVPVCYAYDGESVLIATSLRSKKVANLKENEKASLILDRYTEDWSRLGWLMIVGRAGFIEHGTAFDEAKRLLYQKYTQYETVSPIMEGKSVILRIAIDKVVAWGDYKT